MPSQRFESVDSYLAACRSWCEYQRETHTFLTDSFTGVHLRTADQLVNIRMHGVEGMERSGWSDAQNLVGLAPHMCNPCTNQPVLLVSQAGSGKSFGSQQKA